MLLDHDSPIPGCDVVAPAYLLRSAYRPAIVALSGERGLARRFDDAVLEGTLCALHGCYAARRRHRSDSGCLAAAMRSRIMPRGPDAGVDQLYRREIVPAQPGLGHTGSYVDGHYRLSSWSKLALSLHCYPGARGAAGRRCFRLAFGHGLTGPLVCYMEVGEPRIRRRPHLEESRWQPSGANPLLHDRNAGGAGCKRFVAGQAACCCLLRV